MAEHEFEMLPSEYYNKGIGDRQPFLDRARTFSEHTIPYLVREEGATGTDETSDKYGQAYMARLVQTLKAKIGLALFPPASSAFKLEPSSEDMDEFAREASDIAMMEDRDPDEAIDTELAQAFALVSRSTAAINKEIEVQGVRGAVFDTVLQTLVVGSTIMEKIKDKGVRYHQLDNFVITLDSRGNMVKMCIHEKTMTLPDGIEADEKDDYELYTYAELVDGKWMFIQEVEKQTFNENSYTEKRFPFEHVGWSHAQGDNYYRPYVEELFGAIKEFSDLTEVLTQGSIAAAKTLLFVDQRGGRTRISEVAKSRNLDVINGRADDVTAFQLGKNYDFQIPYEVVKDHKREFAAAFLMNESATRDAERVTAAEIRLMAQELEASTLSGVYSTFANKISKRIVEWVMDEMKVDLETLGLKMIVGLDAIGRSNEARNTDEFVGKVSSLGMMNKINGDELINRYAAYHNIETPRLIKTPSQQKKEAKEQQAAMIAAQAEASAAQSGGAKAGEAAVDAATQ
jgi:hypothetical protein